MLQMRMDAVSYITTVICRSAGGSLHFLVFYAVSGHLPPAA